MAITKFKICSQAMSLLDGATVSSFEDGTKESEWCALNYERIRNSELESGYWNFATHYIECSRENTTPSEITWTYQFLLPNNCLNLIQAYDHNAIEAEYRLEGDRIKANVPRLFVRYIRVIAEDDMPASFVNALVYRIAAEGAEPITGEGKVIDRFQPLYTAARRAARSSDGRQNTPRSIITPANSTWLRARRGGR